MPNDAAAEKPGSAEHGDGATVRCHHGSNSPIHVVKLAKKRLSSIEEGSD
jgi:hypothetical protein